MPTRLTATALEDGTYAVGYSFTDELGQPVIPVAMTWTLTDDLGNVINNRQDVSETPASSGTILLKGDDLAIQDDDHRYEWRVVTFEGTYNSSLGTGLPLYEEVWFKVTNLVAR